MNRVPRVALVSQSYYPVIGGVTEHVHYQALELLRRGYDVTILTGARRPGPESNFGSELAQDFLRTGGSVVRLGHTRRIVWNGRTVTTVGEPGLGRNLSRIDPHHFDLVHVHAPFEPFLPIAAVQYFRGPMVGTFHSTGKPSEHRGFRIFRPWLRALAKRLDGRIAVSAAARDFIAASFPGRYDIIPNGIDRSRFAPRFFARGVDDRPAVGTGSGRCRILTVGRLDPRKGVDVLLRALDQTEDNHRFELRIVGSGPERAKLERFATDRNLPVRFLGVVSEAELTRALEWADLFAAPATFGESFGIVLLEAMAAGLPIVASDIEGYRELTRNCAGVRRVAAGDDKSWSRALSKLAKDEPGRREMSRASSAFVEAFSWSKVVDRIEAVYERFGVARPIARERQDWVR